MHKHRYATKHSREDDITDFDHNLHEVLCGRASWQSLNADGDEDQDDAPDQPWEEVTRKGNKRDPNKKIPVRTVKVTNDMLKRFSETYVKVFQACTGYKINFNLTESTHKYVSMLPPARERNRVLSTLFEYRPRILDCTAGSGADSISFLLDLDPQLLVACSRSCPDGVSHGDSYNASEREFAVLRQNITNFMGTFKPHMRSATQDPCDVKIKHLHAHTYIQSLPDGVEFDMLYFDPSWDDDHDGTTRQYEMSPAELFKHLDDNFWAPIKRKGITVGSYVIKTRWDWRDVQTFLPEIKEEFIARYCIRAQQFRANLQRPGMYGERQGVFYYMVLVHKDYQTINFHNGQAYWNIVKNMQDIWVDKSSQTAVVHPNYSNALKPIKFETQDPNDSVNFMGIKAVQHKKAPTKPIIDRETRHQSTYRPFKPEAYEPAAESGP